MSKHTKGPWKVDGDFRVNAPAFRDHAVEIGPDGKEKLNVSDMVALVYAPWRTSGERYGSNAANAKLIAAAPEMFDLLREVAEVLDTYSDVLDGAEGHPRPNQAMSMLTQVEGLLQRFES